MNLTKEDKLYLQEIISQPGWRIIEKWMDEAENRIIAQIKDNFISLKWEESPKWNAFYAGQADTIRAFRTFIDISLKEKRKKNGQSIER
jgi:hypothetical protein